MILAPAAMANEPDPKKAAQKCFDEVGLDPDMYRIGHTKASCILERNEFFSLRFSPSLFLVVEFFFFFFFSSIFSQSRRRQDRFYPIDDPELTNWIPFLSFLFESTSWTNRDSLISTLRPRILLLFLLLVATT